MLSFDNTDNYLRLKLEQKTDSFSKELCSKFMEKYFRNNRLISQLLDLNIQITEGLDLDQITQPDLDKISNSNPLFLFSECYSQECQLNRAKFGIFRNIAEIGTHYAVKKLHQKKTDQVFTYSTFLPGYLFQDIVILTKLRGLIDQEVSINLVGNIMDYVQCVIDPEKNPNASQMLVSFDYHDPNKNRQPWVRLMTYRLIKLLEWLEFLGLRAEINLFKGEHSLINECRLDKSRMSDLTVGIDILDQFPESVFQFRTLALCVTKPNKPIVLLHTNGLGLLSNLHLEVYISDSPFTHQSDWYHAMTSINDLQRQMDVEFLEIQGDQDRDYNLDIPDVVKNGKTYNWSYLSYNNDGTQLLSYKTKEWNPLNKYQEQLIGALYTRFLDKNRSCYHLLNYHGIWTISAAAIYWKMCRIMVIFANSVRGTMHSIVHGIYTWFRTSSANMWSKLLTTPESSTNSSPTQ